jgi:hypothetical protein
MIAAIEIIARTQIDVRILPGDGKAQRPFGHRVIGERMPRSGD